MKIHPQIILQGKVPAFAILPYEEYETLLQTLEDIEDIEDIEIIISAESDHAEKFPLELIEKIAAGESPIKAYREYRKLTQTDLAKKAKVSKQYISQLETKERSGSLKILKSIAKILAVDLDDIT